MITRHASVLDRQTSEGPETDGVKLQHVIRREIFINETKMASCGRSPRCISPVGVLSPPPGAAETGAHHSSAVLQVALRRLRPGTAQVISGISHRESHRLIGRRLRDSSLHHQIITGLINLAMFPCAKSLYSHRVNTALSVMQSVKFSTLWSLFGFLTLWL